MPRPRLLSALALLLAPCLFVGCDDDAADTTVGGVTTPPVAGSEVDLDTDYDTELDADAGLDATEERPSEELEDES